MFELPGAWMVKPPVAGPIESGMKPAFWLKACVTEPNRTSAALAIRAASGVPTKNPVAYWIPAGGGVVTVGRGPLNK